MDKIDSAINNTNQEYKNFSIQTLQVIERDIIQKIIFLLEDKIESFLDVTIELLKIDKYWSDIGIIFALNSDEAIEQKRRRLYNIAVEKYKKEQLSSIDKNEDLFEKYFPDLDEKYKNAEYILRQDFYKIFLSGTQFRKCRSPFSKKIIQSIDEAYTIVIQELISVAMKQLNVKIIEEKHILLIFVKEIMNQCRIGSERKNWKTFDEEKQNELIEFAYLDYKSRLESYNEKKIVVPAEIIHAEADEPPKRDFFDFDEDHPLRDENILYWIDQELGKRIVNEQTNRLIVFLTSLSIKLLSNPLGTANISQSSAGKSFIYENILKHFPAVIPEDLYIFEDKYLDTENGKLYDTIPNNLLIYKNAETGEKIERLKKYKVRKQNPAWKGYGVFRINGITEAALFRIESIFFNRLIVYFSEVSDTNIKPSAEEEKIIRHFRVLQSDKKIQRPIAEEKKFFEINPEGALEGITRYETKTATITGDICFHLMSAVGLELQLANRGLLLSCDESPEQTEAIMKFNAENNLFPDRADIIERNTMSELLLQVVSDIPFQQYEELLYRNDYAYWINIYLIKVVNVNHTHLRRINKYVFALIEILARLNYLNREILIGENQNKYICASNEDNLIVLRLMQPILEYSLENISNEDMYIYDRLDEVIKSKDYIFKEIKMGDKVIEGKWLSVTEIRKIIKKRKTDLTKSLMALVKRGLIQSMKINSYWIYTTENANSLFPNCGNSILPFISTIGTAFEIRFEQNFDDDKVEIYFERAQINLFLSLFAERGVSDPYNIYIYNSTSTSTSTIDFDLHINFFARAMLVHTLLGKKKSTSNKDFSNYDFSITDQNAVPAQWEQHFRVFDIKTCSNPLEIIEYFAWKNKNFTNLKKDELITFLSSSLNLTLAMSALEINKLLSDSKLLESNTDHVSLVNTQFPSQYRHRLTQRKFLEIIEDLTTEQSGPSIDDIIKKLTELNYSTSSVKDFLQNSIHTGDLYEPSTGVYKKL